MTLIAHLSDTHLAAGPLGVTPAERARAALLRVQAMASRPDLVVLTGDLTDHGAAEEYDLARALLDELDLPLRVVPGNHDNVPALLERLTDGGYVRPSRREPDRCCYYYREDRSDLTLLCCDSSVPGHHWGQLGERQLDWLDEQLTEAGDRTVVVAMHHHPVASGITAMDDIMLADADDLAAVLTRHDSVTRLLVGHLHRAMTANFAGTVVTSAPSTYRQVHLDLLPDALGAFVEEPPGLLLHHLNAGRATTHYVPIHHTGPPLGRI